MAKLKEIVALLRAFGQMSGWSQLLLLFALLCALFLFVKFFPEFLTRSLF